MTLDERQLQYIFSKKNVKIYFYFLTIIFLGLFVTLFVVTTYVFDSNKDFYYEQLSNTEKYKTRDIRLLCAVINCDKAYIREESGYYMYDRKNIDIVKVNRYDLPSSLLGGITYGLDTLINYNNYVFVKNNETPIELAVNLFTVLSIILFFGYSILFFKLSARRYVEEQYDKGHITNYIENKLQKNITEVLHHEMGGPIAIIRSEVESIFKAIFNENCKFKRAYDPVVKQKIENIQFCLFRLDDIMGFMRDAKRLKNSDNETSIYNLIFSIMNTVKCFKIGKIDATYENKNVLDKFSVVMKTGLFSNIIQVMINNSFEAKSTLIVFSGKLVDSSHIELYVKDNGTGIRDNMGKIVKDCNDIYKYGYSTKNANGEIIIKKSLWRYILSFFGVRVNSVSAVRGIGLNLNKQVLLATGGDIQVVETSELGTTFKLLLPVKKLTNKKR